MDDARGEKNYPAHRYCTGNANDSRLWRVECGIEVEEKSSAGERAKDSTYPVVVALDADCAIPHFRGDGMNYKECKYVDRYASKQVDSCVRVFLSTCFKQRCSYENS